MLTVIVNAVLNWVTLTGIVLTVAAWCVLFGYFVLKTVLVDQPNQRNKVQIKTLIMQFVSESQELMRQCPNGLGSDAEVDAWKITMQQWADTVSLFLQRECSEAAARRFNTLGVIRDGLYVGTHPKGTYTKSATVRLNENLISIVENIDAYIA